MWCSCDESDSLTVTVTIGTDRRDLGTYCGSKYPPAVMSTNQRLDVVFVSRLRPVTSSSQPRGFNASYRFVTSTLWTDSESLNEKDNTGVDTGDNT